MKKIGLSNPAALALLSSPEGQKMLANAQGAQSKLMARAFLGFEILLIAGGLVFAYHKIFGFTKWNENKNYQPSNISTAQAKARADAIFSALYGVGANYSTVEHNLTGLNHNSFIRIYNEFGERRGATFVKKNLIEWLQDQFNEDKLTQLRFLIKGFF